MTKFSRAWLALNGALFVGYGLACLFSPSLPAQYAGIELTTASGRNEVVAMYGGLQAGVGGLLLWSCLQADRLRTGLLVLFVLLGSLALGRAFGLLMEGATDYNVMALAYETLAAGLAAFALWGLPARSVVSA